ncbi:pseudouridine synthase [Parabacteroides bouchesdurhonensis]|uniref:pseudouridine synthase n=1 Tax=Parabacteroides bouchesdurhonensis TaxID=1936995 RepID=UPI000C8661B2|nr:pseudouridine synthase [Parabacteroides bouchesdurhonensis]
MSTEERDESQPRPRKVIPSIRRENTNQEGERRPYNQGYNRPDGNYERRSYNRPVRDDRGGYSRSSYGDNRSSYGERPSRPRSYDNREGGYRDGNYSREGGYNRPSYGNNRSSYGNDRPSYGNDQRMSRPSRSGYDEDRPMRAYSASPSGEGMGDGMKKRRPRVGDSRVNSYDNYDNRGGGRPSYGRGYNNNRRPNNNYRRPGGNNYNPNAKYSFQKQLKYKEVLADPNEPIRLNKFLSNAGVCSRREADEFIQAGVVRVNDEVVTELGTKITRQDKVMFHDRPVQIESKVYIVLNKPKNCVTTSDDPQERLTVMDLVKNACQERIYPVGRLDRNTTGVLLLTNDGDLASKLTHPSFKKKKIYHVWLDKNVTIEDMEKIANGLELEDGEIHADAISYASEDDKSQVGIEIHSGRNRIVRRIFESLGYHVTKLDRVYFAGLTKKNLSRGKWRYLNEREVNALRMGAFE